MPSNRPAVALEARNAQITTCTVSIKTLRIDSRQLTQAVFKQLPKCELLDGNSIYDHGGFFLTGTVWGWVNYGADYPGNRVYVVQKGETLYRAEFNAIPLAEIIRRDFMATMGCGPSLYPFFKEVFELEPGERDWHCERWDWMLREILAFDQLYIAA